MTNQRFVRISALSGEVEQTPIVQALRKGLSKLRTQVSVLKQKNGALSAKNRKLACLAEGTIAGKKKAALLRRRVRGTRKAIA